MVADGRSSVLANRAADVSGASCHPRSDNNTGYADRDTSRAAAPATGCQPGLRPAASATGAAHWPDGDERTEGAALVGSG